VRRVVESPRTPESPPALEAQTLFVCRGIESTPEGGVNLEDVLEIVQVPEFPADAGPLHFVAFLRGLSPGSLEVRFRVRPQGVPDAVVATIPMRVNVPEGVADRQISIYGGLRKAQVSRGGWYEVELIEGEGEGERVIARNRFAIGTRVRRDDPAS
jgi:hypothetical protein